MRKIIILILFVIGVTRCKAQDQNDIFEFLSPSKHSPQAVAFVARYVNPPATDTLNKIMEFVDSLVANGTYDKIAEMCFVANNSTNSLLGLKGLANSTTAGTMTFTPYQGFTGNGIDGYINTGFNDSTGSSLYQRTSFSWGVYSRTLSNSSTMSGVAITGQTTGMYLRDGGVFYAYFRENTGISISNSDSRGMFISTLNGTTATSYLYTGTSNLSVTETVTPLKRLNLNPFISARNFNRVAQQFGTREMALWFYGATLTAQDCINIKNCFERLMDYYGKGVIP
jgi:hypothetical protein